LVVFKKEQWPKKRDTRLPAKQETDNPEGQRISELEAEVKRLRAAQIDQERISSSLSSISEIILNETKIEDVLNKVLEELLNIFSCDRAWLLSPCDPDAAFYHVPMECARPEWPGALKMGVNIPTDDFARSIFKLALAAPEVVRFDPEENTLDPEEPINSQFHIRSQMLVVLRPRSGKPWLLGIHHCAETVTYSESDRYLFKLLSERLADGLSSLLFWQNTRSLFDNAEVSIWNEDLSQVRERLEDIRQQGVKDLRAHLEKDKSLVRELVDLIQVQQVNKATLDLFEAASEEELLKGIHETFVESSISVLTDELCALWDRKTHFRSEISFKSLKGRDIHALISFRIPRTQEGFHRVPITIVDITARKIAENHYKTLVQTSPVCIHEINLEGNLISMNPAGLTMMGVEEESEVCGLKYLDVPVPQDRQRVSDLLEQAKRGIGSLFEFSAMGENGLLHFSSSFEPISDVTGKVIKLMGVTQDVTSQRKVERELRENERQFRTVFEQAAVGVAIIDSHTGQFLKLNQKYCDITGYSSDEMIKMSFREITHPDDLQEDLDNMAKLRAGIIPDFTMEKRYRHKNGSIVWVKLAVSPSWDPGERPDHHIAVVVDITEQKHTQEQLILAKEEAESANKAKSEFLASMSHELRTPLNAVLGYAQMLQYDPQNPLSSNQKEHTDSIIEGGSHLLDLINEILDLAKVESNQLELQLDEVVANQIVHECVELISPLCSEQNISLTDRFSRGPESLLRTDPKRFKQVLFNLLSNAVKFNKTNGKVTIEAEETNDGFLRLSVTDTGIGIAEEDRDSVFQLFHRLGADPMITREGTGIGLTVTKLIVERMAGTIGFASTEDEGSCFWVEIPLATNSDIMVWSDTMRIGIDALDKDHQVIAGLLNKVAHQTVHDLNQVIKTLTEYTFYHFRREEAVMQAIDYPGFAKHVKRHEHLSSKVKELTKSWETEHSTEVLRKLREFLKNLLFNDILRTDSDIALHAKGKEKQIQAALDELEP